MLHRGAAPASRRARTASPGTRVAPAQHGLRRVPPDLCGGCCREGVETVRAGDGIRTRDVQLGKLAELVDSTPQPDKWRHSSMISPRTASVSAEAPCPAA